MFKRDHHNTDSQFVIVEKDPLSGQITEDHRTSHKILSGTSSLSSSPRAQSPVRALLSAQKSSSSLDNNNNNSNNNNHTNQQYISSPQSSTLYSLNSPAATSSAHNLGSKLREKLTKNLRPTSYLLNNSSSSNITSTTNLSSPSTPASPSPAISIPIHSPNMALTTTFSASSLSSSSSSPSSSSNPPLTPSSPGSYSSSSMSLPKHSILSSNNHHNSNTATSTSPSKYSALFHLASSSSSSSSSAAAAVGATSATSSYSLTSSSSPSSPSPMITISSPRSTLGPELNEPNKALLELLAVVDPTNERLNRSSNGSGDSKSSQIPDKLDPRKTQLASSIMSSFPSSQSRRAAPSVTAVNLPSVATTTTTTPSQPLQQQQQQHPGVQQQNQPMTSLPVSFPPELPPRPLSSQNITLSADYNYYSDNNYNNNNNSSNGNFGNINAMDDNNNNDDDDDDNQSYVSDADSFTIGDEKRLSVMVMSPGSNTSSFNGYNNNNNQPSTYEYSPQQQQQQQQQQQFNAPALTSSPVEVHLPQSPTWHHPAGNNGPDLIASSRAHGTLSPTYNPSSTLTTSGINTGNRSVSAESTASTASNLTSVSTVSNISQGTYLMDFGAAGDQQQSFPSTPHLVINKSRESVVSSTSDSVPHPILNVPKTRQQQQQQASQDGSTNNNNNTSHPDLPKIDTSTQTDNQDMWNLYPTDTPITPNQNHYNHSSVPPGSESSASVYSPELTQQQNHYRSVESTQDGAAHQHFYQQLQSTFPSSTAHINDVENKMAALTTAEPTGTYSHSSSSSNSNSNSITSQSVSDTLQQHQQQQQLYSKTTVPLSLMPRSPALDATVSSATVNTHTSVSNTGLPSPIRETSRQQPLYFDPASLSASDLTAQGSNNSSISLASSGYSYGMTPNASKLNVQQFQPTNNIFHPSSQQQQQQQQQRQMQMPSDDLIAQYNQELEVQEYQRLNAKTHQQALGKQFDLEIPAIKVNDMTHESLSSPHEPPQLQYSDSLREAAITTPSGPSSRSSSSPPPSAGKENSSSGKHGRHLLGIFKGHKKKTSNTPPASNAHSRDSSVEPPKNRKTSPYEGLIVQPSQEQVNEWEREAENLVLRLPGSDSLQPLPPFPSNSNGLYGSPVHADSDGSLSSDRDLLSPNAANSHHHHHHGTGGNSAAKKLSRFSALITGNASGNRNRSSSTSSVFSNVSDVSVHEDANVHLSPSKAAGATETNNTLSSNMMLHHDANVSSSSVNLTFSKDTDVTLHRAIDLHEAGRLTEAAELFRELADPDHTNHPLAQVLYGLSLRHGWGVEVNETLAFQYLRLAGKNSAMLHQIIAETGLSSQDGTTSAVTAVAAGATADSLPVTPVSGQYPSDQENNNNNNNNLTSTVIGSRARSRALSSAAVAAAAPAATAAELQSHALKAQPNSTAGLDALLPSAIVPPSSSFSTSSKGLAAGAPAAAAAAAATTTTTTANATATATTATTTSTGGFARGELTLATYELANCFRNGWGCDKDPAAALTYYEAAAHLGDPDAMYEAAWCYLNGFGTKGKKKDKYKAAQYYRMAESKGKHEVGNSWIWKEKYDPK
ncbi:uncharacterized protein SAPINGB_P001997 [Magnusiomyces paraingens]|uniref:Uncharacterized protein n=1 Tax=Magnusiomyces paraingens TaxID=2606893 RepID=A0A5E8BDV1_9ASCO|nr:uncharacterized protein SAPINGB_P001997 [Saprochaete ingens]VVT48883.1 unnamed protein product [Saprochaete ingens]